MSIFGLFKRNTNIIKKIDKSNSYSFDCQKNSYIFMPVGEVKREGISGGLCTPAQGEATEKGISFISPRE